MISRADHHLALYVPSRTRHGRKSVRGVTPDAMLAVAVNFFPTEFGGATVVEAQGHHAQVAHRATRRNAFTSSPLLPPAPRSSAIFTLQELAADFCVRFEQESVAFEIDGVFRLGRVFKPTCHSERSEESTATGTLSRLRTHGFLVPLLMNTGMDLAKEAKEAKQAFVSFASFARPTPRLVFNRSFQGNSWFRSVSE